MTDGANSWGEARGPLLLSILSLMWIISGGLVAALTGPLDLAHGSWSAAYQVLVGGVLQAGLGVAQYALVTERPSTATLVAELLGWNIGSLAVIAGTVMAMPLIVDAGGLMLVVTLVLLIRAVRSRDRGPAWALWTYRILLTLTLCSIPIGLVLAHLRAV